MSEPGLQGGSVVCALDVTPAPSPATPGLRAAALLARRLDVPLYLVHGLEPSRRSELLAARQSLERVAAVLSQAGTRVEVMVEEGEPDEVVRSLSRQCSASLLVLLAKQGDRHLGRVAERVVQRASCAVLVIKDEELLFAWLEGSRPLRVLAAADLDATFEPVRSVLVGLRRVGPCDVTVVHASWPPADRRRLGLRGPVDLVGQDPEEKRILLRELAARVGTLPGAGAVELLVEPSWGRVDDHVLTLASRERAELIVIGSRQEGAVERLWHGSVSAGVLRHATTNVLCAPRQAVAFAADETRPLPVLRTALVPTDFSEDGDAAIPFAYALVGEGGTVFLTHVLDAKRPAAELAAERRRALEALHARVPPAARGGGHVTLVDVLEATDPVDALVADAERLGVDVICLGRRGHGGLADALPGSVARGVMQRSPRPVLVVKKR